MMQSNWIFVQIGLPCVKNLPFLRKWYNLFLLLETLQRSPFAFSFFLVWHEGLAPHWVSAESDLQSSLFPRLYVIAHWIMSNKFCPINFVSPVMAWTMPHSRVYGVMPNIFIFLTGYHSPNFGRVQPRWGPHREALFHRIPNMWDT